MEIIEVTAWLQTKTAIREINKQVDAFATDRWNRVGDVPRNYQRVQIIQMRIAEELRAIDDQDLAKVLVRWILRADLSVYFIRTYVHTDGPAALSRAIPRILEHVAMEVTDAFARSLGLDA